MLTVLRSERGDAEGSAVAWPLVATVGQSARSFAGALQAGLSRCRILPALTLALALAGCAGTTRIATIYCLTPPQLQKLKDAEPKRIGSELNGNAQDDLKIIAGSNIELRTYGEGLLDVLGGCTGTDAK